MTEHIWNHALDLATFHINDNMQKIYLAMKDDLELISLLKNNYPHACIVSSLGELISNNSNIDYIDAFECVNFTFNDLNILSKFDQSKDYINDHIRIYTNRIISFLNSSIFTLMDFQILLRKSGIRNINLCGDFEFINNKLMFYNKKDWVKKDGYEMLYSKSNCYWRSYSYCDEPIYPRIEDFNCRVNDINVILYPENNWIPIMIYVKTRDNPELESLLHQYRTNIINFLNTDSTKSHFWEQWKTEHETLEKAGLKIWIVEYKDLVDKLIYIHQYYGILLTQVDEVQYNTKTEEEYYDQILNHTNFKINKEHLFPNQEFVVKNKDQTIEYESYLNEMIKNKEFLNEINMFQCISESLYNFLKSETFINYYSQFGTYEIPFKILINDKYYKELTKEQKEKLYTKYTLSEIEYMRMGNQSSYIKSKNVIECPNHTCNYPLYYKKMSDDELNDLECMNVEFSHDAYEILLIHDRTKNYIFEYDYMFQLYIKTLIIKKNHLCE